jgi:HlyD family secretion protein
MKRKPILVSILVLFIVVIGYILISHKNKTSANNFIVVTKGEVTVKVTAVGNIVSAKTAAVKSPISGIVAEIFHEEGDVVKKSDPLLTIKPQPTPKDYATAKQQVEIDSTKEAAGLAEVKRYENLIQQKAISPNDQEYARALNEYKNAHLNRELSQKNLALLEEGKADIKGKSIDNVILSPIDGYVVNRAINLGDPVTPQSDYQAGSILFTVADMNTLIFKGQVSEADASKLKSGVEATVKLAALPDVAIPGKLSLLGLQSVQLGALISSGSSDPNTKVNSPFNVGYKVEVAHLAVPANIQLRSGYSATAEITIAHIADTLIIPERVIQFEQDKPYVWRVNKKEKPEKQVIQLGLSDGVNVQVLKGLKLGDHLLEAPPDSEKDKEK